MTDSQLLPRSRVPYRVAAEDIGEAFRRHHLAVTLSLQDIAQRYRRSALGAGWLTINIAVLIATLGLLFSVLFRAPVYEFLPYVALGIILWNFISNCASEGCTTFITSEGIILQIRMPLFTHILRTFYRNAVILGHNFLIFPVVLLVLWRPPTWHALLAIPGMVLLSLNILWMMQVVAIFCTRYRDMTQVVQNAVQVLFYVTPIMWLPSILPDERYRALLDLNPFFHLVSVVRDPLLGTMPSLLSWSFVTLMAMLGWLLSLRFYGRFIDRVPYWL